MERDRKNTSLTPSPFSLWLSWQELSGHKLVFTINVILVAFLIAIPVSLDLLGKARKSSVEARIDYIGPSLILVPQGVLSSDLVTAELKGRTYSSSIFHSLRHDLSPHVRSAESRLTERLPVDGKDLPLVGIDFQNVYSYPFTRYTIGANEVLLGTIAAEKLNKKKGDSVHIQSQTFSIAGIIPTSGGIDDVSVFLRLPVLQRLAGQEGRINEIRLFPRSASAYERLKTDLKTTAHSLNMIDAYRGDTAERDIDTTLRTYQKALYSAAFILIAICIMISTYINLDDRRVEVSTVYTLGATQGTIFQILTLRTIWITLLGSVFGQLIAVVFTTAQSSGVPLGVILSAGPFAQVVFWTVCLGVLVTMPFAFYSVYRRNLVSHL